MFNLISCPVVCTFQFHIWQVHQICLVRGLLENRYATCEAEVINNFTLWRSPSNTQITVDSPLVYENNSDSSESRKCYLSPSYWYCWSMCVKNGIVPNIDIFLLRAYVYQSWGTLTRWGQKNLMKTLSTRFGGCIRSIKRMECYILSNLESTHFGSVTLTQSNTSSIMLTGMAG